MNEKIFHFVRGRKMKQVYMLSKIVTKLEKMQKFYLIFNTILVKKSKILPYFLQKLTCQLSIFIIKLCTYTNSTNIQSFATFSKWGYVRSNYGVTDQYVTDQLLLWCYWSMCSNVVLMVVQYAAKTNVLVLCVRNVNVLMGK